MLYCRWLTSDPSMWCWLDIFLRLLSANPSRSVSEKSILKLGAVKQKVDRKEGWVSFQSLANIRQWTLGLDGVMAPMCHFKSSPIWRGKKRKKGIGAFGPEWFQDVTLIYAKATDGKGRAAPHSIDVCSLCCWLWSARTDSTFKFVIVTIKMSMTIMP